MSYFFRGLLLGLMFGIPAGAIGALALQRTIAHGFKAGLATGLGCSAADLLYACVGAFGITVISDFATRYAAFFRWVGGLFFLAIGVSFFRKSEMKKTQAQPCSLGACFASSFGLAVMNPATVLTFLAAFSSMGISSALTLTDGIGLVSGIGLGTVCWWLALGAIASHLRGKVTERIYVLLRRILGVCMLGFGLWMILK